MTRNCGFKTYETAEIKKNVIIKFVYISTFTSLLQYIIYLYYIYDGVSNMLLLYCKGINLTSQVEMTDNQAFGDSSLIQSNQSVNKVYLLSLKIVLNIP